MTGNNTYYNKAFDLHTTFENDFYDSARNSYITSVSPTNNNKNLKSNLKLIQSYLKAFELYNSTILTSQYNVTVEIPDLIFNQDYINITSTYSVEKDSQYYNISTNSYETFTMNYTITSADISYLLKYPNETLFDIREQQIISDNITLLYEINDSLPIGNGYYLYIFANTSKYGTAVNQKRFNVVSGLVNESILGLPNTVYQGPIFNITIPVNNTRENNVTLTVSMEGEDIIDEVQIITFDSLVLTNVSFNLTAELDAVVGPHTLTFTFKSGNIIYLEIVKIIEIGYSFDYANLLYQSKIVIGNNAYVTMNIINFLPNSTQSLNVSFSGSDIQDTREEFILSESETRTISYELVVSEDVINDTIQIEMTISKGATVFYTKLFTIEIAPRFEILSVSFPNVVSQGKFAYFIMIILNNQENSEQFTIYVNGQAKSADIDGLAPGENRIVVKVLPTINPYDFQSKTFTFILKDSLGEILAQNYFEVNVELSAFNLIMFYLLPIIIPVGIILYYKNKEIKHRMLRR